MDTLLSIKVFRQVVESGSFTAAAVALDMSVAMVSKHVQNLEKRLGTRLLTRTSRRVALNDPGTLYYERSSEALNLLEEAEQALGLEVIPTDAPLPYPTLYAVTHGRRRLAARVRSFLEFLQRQVEGDRIRK